MQQFVAGLVAALEGDDLEELKTTLKCSSAEALERKLLQRLLARAQKEKVRYAPFDFEFFCYPLLDFTVYGQVLERVGLDRCYARVFSRAAPTGEHGLVDCSQIESILSREQFDALRAVGWPDTWKEPT